MIDLGCFECPLDDDVRLGKGFVDVTLFDVTRASDIVLDLDRASAIRHFVVDRLRAGLPFGRLRTSHRLEGVGDHRQHLVLDLDGPHGLFGQRLRLGRHRRHRLTHPAHLVGQNVMIPVQNLGDGDDPLVVAHLGDVVKRDANGPQRLGRAHVYRLDASMSIRAGEDAAVQHMRQADIGRKPLLACHFANAVLARSHMAQDTKIFGFQLH